MMGSVVHAHCFGHCAFDLGLRRDDTPIRISIAQHQQRNCPIIMRLSASVSRAVIPTTLASCDIVSNHWSHVATVDLHTQRVSFPRDEAVSPILQYLPFAVSTLRTCLTASQRIIAGHLRSGSCRVRLQVASYQPPATTRCMPRHYGVGDLQACGAPPRSKLAPGDKVFLNP
jgi:hypothetical protein